MPVNLPGLQSDLESFFGNPPPSDNPATARASAASSWASAMQSYATAVVPPSTQVATAATALETALVGAFSGDVNSILVTMETAFLAFATTVGAGMAPAFVATPPPAPVGFATLTAPAASPAAAAATWATLIDTWFKTGTAVPSGGGGTVNWS